MAYTERFESATVARGTSHVTTKQDYKYSASVDIQKRTIKSNSHSFRITRDKSAMRLLKRKAQRYKKATNNNTV